MYIYGAFLLNNTCCQEFSLCLCNYSLVIAKCFLIETVNNEVDGISCCLICCFGNNESVSVELCELSLIVIGMSALFEILNSYLEAVREIDLGII